MVTWGWDCAVRSDGCWKYSSVSTLLHVRMQLLLWHGSLCCGMTSSVKIWLSWNKPTNFYNRFLNASGIIFVTEALQREENKWNEFFLLKEKCRWLDQCRGFRNYKSLEQVKCSSSPNLLLFTYVARLWEMGNLSYFYVSMLMLLGLVVDFCDPPAGLQIGFWVLEEGGVVVLFCWLRFNSQLNGLGSWLLWYYFICTAENVDLSFGKVEEYSSFL